MRSGLAVAISLQAYNTLAKVILHPVQGLKINF